MHPSLSLSVADCCSAYALSDEKEPMFSSPCDHYHGNSCSWCKELKTKISDIQAYLKPEDLGLLDEELDGLCHIYDKDTKHGNTARASGKGCQAATSRSKCSVLEGPSTEKQNAGLCQSWSAWWTRLVIRHDHSGLGLEIFVTEILWIANWLLCKEGHFLAHKCGCQETSEKSKESVLRAHCQKLQSR